ncbi:MAG TPA: GNAT family N-acetyltransferase [Roseateles sp.]
MLPTIRHATPEDAPLLASFAAQAFTDTYREISDAQEIADYVAEHFQPEVMAGVIADPHGSVLLAWVDRQLAGYAVLKSEPAPDCVTGPAPLKLWRLYLGEGFIGRGLGARLMNEVHAEAWRRGARTLWLGVYDRNVRAVAFYERFGFAKVGGQEFLFGGQIYIDPVYAAAVRPAE